MTWFIDRRLNGKNKSTVNRQRFLRRYKSQIKQSISEAINKRSVTDVDSGESVSIPTDDISEPMFHQGRGGLRHRVHPGNDHFVQNDRIERPQGAAAVQEADKARPVRMERVRMSSSFRYLKMNILICCSKI
ncbi:hypothetical protein SF123566_7886 [Shigella flexneri 1235-66]|nr:hypothetical protein SF123566_7886 [Shigella flexneri 1235-66]